MSTTVVKLTPQSRDLFKKMHFAPIPEEANYVAFLPDGEAVYNDVVLDIEY